MLLFFVTRILGCLLLAQGLARASKEEQLQRLDAFLDDVLRSDGGADLDQLEQEADGIIEEFVHGTFLRQIDEMRHHMLRNTTEMICEGQVQWQSCRSCFLQAFNGTDVRGEIDIVYDDLVRCLQTYALEPNFNPCLRLVEGQNITLNTSAYGSCTGISGRNVVRLPCKETMRGESIALCILAGAHARTMGRCLESFLLYSRKPVSHMTPIDFYVIPMNDIFMTYLESCAA